MLLVELSSGFPLGAVVNNSAALETDVQVKSVNLTQTSTS